ncbi:MAG TPA: hypothetical protein VIX19_05785 [Terriglobales bacterium]
MRRLISISAIASLMFSSVSPLLAASTCEHVKQMVGCHRIEEQKTQKPHCEMMHHHDAEETSPPTTDGPAMRALPSTQNCPMDCCQFGHRTDAVSLTTASSLPQPAILDQTLSVVSVVFSSTGFSSHTDRGPPTA